MAMQRMTAKKVRVSELMNGKWVKREGLEPSFVVTDSGNKVSRARIMGTIVQVFMAEDGNFGSATLDDGTDTIRAKTFKTVKPLDEFNEGDLVDMIGKVREYNGEVYIIPETVTRVQDPNTELLRRIELIKQARESAGRPPEEVTEEAHAETSPGEKVQEKTKSGKAEKPDGEKEEPEEDNTELRKSILQVIGSDPEGVEYSTITGKVDAEESRIEGILNEILSEGICYEPTPGKIKKI